MPDQENIEVRERLVGLETKLAFIQGLLEEIRSDLKNQPTKEEINSLEDRIETLEEKHITLKDRIDSVAIKAGIASGVLGLLGGLLIRFIA